MLEPLGQPRLPSDGKVGRPTRRLLLLAGVLGKLAEEEEADLYF